MAGVEDAEPAEGGGAPLRRLIPLAVAIPIALAFLRLAGEKAGLFGESVGRWGLVAIFCMLVAVFMLYLARLADEAEAKRQRIEAENVAAAPALAQRALELERANAELAEAKAQLERSNEELQRFATVASHDLREPLRVVSGFADLLGRRYGDELEADGKRFIEAITSGVARMDEMISDLLAYARAGRIDQPLERVDVNEVVRDTVSGLQRAIEDSGAELQIEGLPAVTGNPASLRQLFQNLISNAIKFVGDDAPRIRIWAAEVPNGWRFTVRDNGIGVAAEETDHIFGMFARSKQNERYAGTGVGLAVCQRIVEVHGGRIWVEPAPGGGSQFMFTIADARRGPAPLSAAR